jgi:glycosyltransferase involved in cell wall biosynthesis
LDRYRLHLFGSEATFPEYAGELRRAAAGLPVVFEGAFERSRVAEVYGRLDVLVVPSLWLENSPLVIHEAFQAGLPVVAARSGGIVDLIADGVNGLLYEPSSAEQLSALLARLIDDPAECRRLAANRPPVKTIDDDARDWVAIYGEVRERRGPASVT